MNSETFASSRLQDLVIGLVAPIGTDLDPVCQSLVSNFARLGYRTHELRLSKLLEEVPQSFGLKLEYVTEADRYKQYMNAGNQFRRLMNRGDALSMVAVGAIREIRKIDPAPKNVFILRTLKHPAEVESLRNIYGPAFVLFSLSSSRTERVNHLAKKICRTNQKFDFSEFLWESESLISRDQQETDELMGQNVRKVFPLADFFVDVDSGTEEAAKRLVELLLGNVFVTPTRAEYGMFLAHASAWRSSSLQRQVGAVIATVDGDVIAIGTNDVPKPGGGLYWEGDASDSRDFHRRGEINDEMKGRMFVEVVQRMISGGMNFGEGHDLYGEVNPERVADWLISKKHMENTRIMSVIEFGRCVHAEMAALMDAARRGAAVNDSILYSTTFPCHECARHIVAAGIKEVFYIDPYPKSLVNQLYPDSIRIEGQECGGFVRFRPFVGVAPRRYQDLFKLGGMDRKNLVNYAHDWNASLASPRLGEYPDRTQLINGLTEKMAVAQFNLELRGKTNGDN